jgi:hypothetical protein
MGKTSQLIWKGAYADRGMAFGRHDGTLNCAVNASGAAGAAMIFSFAMRMPSRFLRAAV